jgi:hypothetical protein
MLAIILSYGIVFWGSYLFGGFSHSSLWEAFVLPFVLPVLYTYASPLYAMPLVLFAILYVMVTSIWTQALLRTGYHILTAAGAAALSMGAGAWVAALTRDDTFAFSHGFPIFAIPRFTTGAVLAALIVSSWFARKRRPRAQHP